jgi:protocatechuate 3,4-dioxygenase beta subunit
MNRAVVLAAFAAALTLSGGNAHAGVVACPAVNPPDELVLVAGSGQTAQLGAPFPQALHVALASSNGCPLTGNLAGNNVTFDAPGSGASGIFAGSGTHTVVVGTDAQGAAVAPVLTANDTVGYYTVRAQSAYGTVNLSLFNTANGVPSAIAAVGTTSREAVVGGSYGDPLQVRVTDANGNPVQGVAVGFAIRPGATGAAGDFVGGQATATTDSNGLATSPMLVANGMPGRFTATASTAGVPTAVIFALDNHAATATLQRSTQDPTATVETRYRTALRARLLDAGGQPIEGATVTFAISTGANGAAASFLGGAAQATAVTDVSGVATAPMLVANKVAGAFTASATAPGAASTEYALENRAARPAVIAAGVANGQSTTVRTRFPIPLAVTVADRDGNPVAGAVVAFGAPARGAGGRFTVRGHLRRVVHVRTNRKGIAIAPAFTANASTGGYVVIATVQTSGARVGVALLNVPRG